MSGAQRPPVGRPRPRSVSRELVLQGLYEWLIKANSGGEHLGVIDAHLRGMPEFEQADAGHYSALLEGTIRQAEELRTLFAADLDRPLDALSPVEHAVLLIGAYELQHCLDIPYRVVINEAIELSKSFGGNEGHRYVNGVLDRVAARVRALEVEAARRKGHG